MKKWLALAISTSLFTGCATLPWQSEQQPTDATAAPLPVADEPPSIDVAEALVEPTPETVTPISPQQEADVWVRIKRQLTLDAPEVPRLVSQREWYLNNPHYMERVAKRAQPFMYFIVEEIERRNMPLELALLPIVESAFDPFAYSHGRAAGIWQFIPGTARHYGLEINWWYDGRRDVYAAPHAALDYLDAL